MTTTQTPKSSQAKASRRARPPRRRCGGIAWAGAAALLAPCLLVLTGIAGVKQRPLRRRAGLARRHRAGPRRRARRQPRALGRLPRAGRRMGWLQPEPARGRSSVTDRSVNNPDHSEVSFNTALASLGCSRDWADRGPNILRRRLHDSADDWDPPHDAVFGAIPGRRPFGVQPLFDHPELVSHQDYCPGNVVFRDGLPAAFIDTATAPIGDQRRGCHRHQPKPSRNSAIVARRSAGLVRRFTAHSQPKPSVLQSSAP